MTLFWKVTCAMIPAYYNLQDLTQNPVNLSTWIWIWDPFRLGWLPVTSHDVYWSKVLYVNELKHKSNFRRMFYENIMKSKPLKRNKRFVKEIYVSYPFIINQAFIKVKIEIQSLWISSSKRINYFRSVIYSWQSMLKNIGWSR